MEKKQKKHARSRSFTGAGLASFLRSTVASFSSSFPSSSRSNGGRSSFNHRNAFSGPIVSIVPPEARGGRGGGSSRTKQRSGYRTPEPSSPKVSCIGQIKRSGSRRQKKVNPSCGKNGGACPLPPRHPTAAAAEGTKPCARPRGSLVKRMSFFRRSRSRSRSRSSSKGDGCGNGKGSSCALPAAPAPAGLGQMKRFTSGRAAFQDFDWREEERRSRDSEEEEEEDEGFVAHSAPLTLGGGVVASEPRKEVNLWRRRPMAPPTPLQLP
ncbi:hypothetical protein BAE44_0003251 [Dichanthelium oligosanthes]|uniref:Syringolide-induced protein 14-1-1 n=1 Tax=Dichanthelium oligosanthes TaxID=888268 RepID=A0A1E5WEU7_9POAL|nr:hypothetical protein BAE44_0003251 [Dichanthelium oligosanthes]